MNRMGPDWLEQRFAQGAIIVIDGAMGTELQSRGVAMHEKVWSAGALFSDPDCVRAAHLDYINAGAEVIITNTFASARHMLDPAGLGDEVASANRLAVALAREAREQAGVTEVAIAGSLCEWVHADTPWAEPARLRQSLGEQAGILAEAGVDLLTIEMGSHPDHTAMAIEQALDTGLPVWAGLSCRRDPASGALTGFDPPYPPFDEILAAVARQPIGLINIMHSAIADTAAGLAAVRGHWSGPMGAYPESGHFTMPDWQFVDIISAADLVAEARAWVKQGVQLVGGCCGLTLAHIKALRQAFPRV